MPPRKCCCACKIFEDDFNRPNAPNLGLDWASINFEILDNTAYCGTGPAFAICNTPHPLDSATMVVSIDTVEEEEGHVYEILLNVLDPFNHHKARFIRLTETDSVIELIKVTGGAEAILASETIISLVGTQRTFTAMIASNEFCAFVTLSVVSMVYVNPDLILLGDQAGFATPSSEIKFDNFYFQQHKQTQAECPACVCQCGNYYVPPILNLHLEGTGRLAPLNCDIELRWNRVDSYWEGSGTCCGIDWDFILTCGDGLTCDTFGLLLTTVQCASGDLNPRAPSDCTCFPFTAVFGPYFIGAFDLACICNDLGPPLEGTWTATVTESA